MQEIIKITEKDGKKAVSARELYKYLCILTDFTTWCKRMFEYGFIEGNDYAVIKIDEPEKQLFAYQNPNPKLDYVLSLDCAKEISMLQRTDQGKLARLYFIECEKQLLRPKELTRKELAQMVIDAETAKELAEAKVLELAPKAEIYDQISDCTNLKSVGEVAKILGYGRNEFFKLLRENKYLMFNNIPYQKYIDAGYFEVKTKPIPGLDKDQSTTYITAKGELYFARLLHIKI